MADSVVVELVAERDAVCLSCGERGAQIRGLCERCYHRHRRDGTIDDYPIRDREMVEISGVTYRQLDFWCRQGYLRPHHAGGTGNVRQWTLEEVEVVATMARLVSAGLKPSVACDVARAGTPRVEIGPGVYVEVRCRD